MGSTFVIRAVCALAAFSAYPAFAMEFEVQANGGNCNECTWVLASGDIESGDTEKLKAFVDRHRPPTNVRFNSPGGNLGEALKLGRFLRAEKWDAFVGEQSALLVQTPGDFTYRDQKSICYSACVYAFAGGVHRRADENSIGVHQFDREPHGDRTAPLRENASDISVAQGLVAVLSAYVEEMGVSVGLVTLASLIPPAEIYPLTSSELQSFNLDNSKGDVASATWQLVPLDKGAMALTSQAQNGAGRKATLGVICKTSRSDAAFLLLMLKDKTNPSLAVTLDGFAPAEFWTEIDGQSVRIDPSRIHGPFRRVDSNATLSITVSRTDLELLANAKTIRLYGDSGAVIERAYGELGGSFSMKGAADAIKLALKNCPSW